MGLQVRLAHSLGERLIDLQDRDVDRPIVVGRSSAAEVQIPSTTVAKRHCILFVHEGKWAVQDAASPTGTYLNGKPVKEPAPIRSGDVLTIGAEPEAPTLTVDPYGLMTSGAQVEEESPVPFSRDPQGSAPPAPAQPPPAPIQPPPAAGARYSVPRAPAIRPVAYAPPTPVHGAPPPQYVAPTYAPPQEEPQDQWSRGEWADVPQESTYYVPKPRRVSPAVMVWTVLFCLALLGGVIWAVRNAQQKHRQNLAKVPVVILEEAPSTRPVAPPPPTTTKARATTATAPTPPEMTEPEPPDPRREEESWQAVERTRLEDPVIALVKFNDYLELQPDTPFRKDVDKYIDEALDRLWWARVVELFGEIDEAKKEIAKRQEDVKLSRDEQFKKNLEEEIRQWSEKRDSAERRLRTEMKFSATEPPNLHDSQRLAYFRSQRPEAYYQKWKTEVHDLIRRTKGQRLPWKQVR